MSINTRNIMRIWHSLINIVDRIEICVPMVSIAQFSSSKNIRCVHTIKNEEHQRCIYQPDNPLTVFFRKADILTCPEKDCKFCQKQKCCDHCRLCVPSCISPPQIQAVPSLLRIQSSQNGICINSISQNAVFLALTFSGKVFPATSCLCAIPIPATKSRQNRIRDIPYTSMLLFPRLLIFSASPGIIKQLIKKYADKTHAAKAQITSLFFFIFSFLLSFYIPKYSLI